jgi:hypothetical protein
MNSLGQEEVQEQIRPAKAANLFVANGQGALRRTLDLPAAPL